MDPIYYTYTRAFSEGNWNCMKVMRNEMRYFGEKKTSPQEADVIAKESYQLLLDKLNKMEDELKSKVKGDNKEAVQHVIVSTRQGDESMWTMYKNVIKKALVKGATKLTAFMAACAAIGIPIAIIMCLI